MRRGAAMVVGVVLAVAGCDDGGAGPAGADAGDGTGGMGDPCDEAPVTTWDNFGAAFLATQCNGCHASTALERYGAPGRYVFDSEDDVVAQREAILAAATGASPTMPPAGGVREAERQRLLVWLTCDLR